ncbi:MAG: hypothetical protein DLM64_16090 [Solirubrobacterales bacterium]|nr:MAG: hypothetical protein DLM64_16090 [Solirubrobacterales bacterium]
MLLGPKRLTLAAASLLTSLLPSLLPATPAPAAPSSLPVSAFPSPGSHFVSPKGQIAFRGLSPAQLGSIAVFGSTSGAHAGRVLADSDNAGGSFIPNRAFNAGELVTVSTSLNLVGGIGGRFQFRVATPAGPNRYAPLPPEPRVRGDVLRFHSRPDLAPAAVKVVKRSRTAPGDIFVAPQQGPVQDGPMILGPGGGLIWFKRIPPRDWATDFRVQQYQGKPVLTWWQGLPSSGVGVGEDVISDAAYHETAVVRAANGLSADLHEFQLTPQGTALITAYYPVYADASAVRGASKHEIVLDSVVQEIDVPTGLVLFQWDSLDHVPVTDGYAPPPLTTRSRFDYFHVNSVDQDRDGNLVVSARNTWAAYKLDHRTGATIWQLGGKHSSFKLGRSVAFAFQHDVRIRSGADGLVTLFDDGAGPPSVHRQSRGLTLRLDLVHRTATHVAEQQHSPALLANFEGNVQQLPGGDEFVGWGQQPYWSEFNSRRQMIFDARFVAQNSSYRAYRFPWSGTPQAPPAIAASSRGRATIVYASWNGATSVAFWRVLGGSSSNALRSVATVHKRGFETTISLGARRYVAVQALDRSGHRLGQSSTVRAQR